RFHLHPGIRGGTKTWTAPETEVVSAPPEGRGFRPNEPSGSRHELFCQGIRFISGGRWPGCGQDAPRISLARPFGGPAAPEPEGEDGDREEDSGRPQADGLDRAVS